MRHNIQKYLHIAGHTLLCQLVIYGVQWPILMAWGYALHPLSILGNIVFTPFVFALIAICSGIFFCNLIGVVCKPLYSLVSYIISGWLYLFTIPTGTIELQFAQPHWSVLLAIPATTYTLMWYIRGVWRLNITLFLVFTTTAIGLSVLPYSPRTYWLTPNTLLARVGDRTLLIQTREHKHTRYSRNWLTYTLLPTLRQQYGTNTIDHVFSAKKRSRIKAALNKQRLVSGGTGSTMTFLYSWMLRRRHSPC